MARKIQTTYTAFPSKRVFCLGDSLTHSIATGILERYLWGYRLQTSLRALGCKVTAAINGKDGRTSAQALALVSTVWARGVPDLFILYTGANDTPGTTVTNQTAIVNAVKAQGCTRNIILGQHYRNLSGVNADTVGAQEATFAVMRTEQQAAAAATGAVYADWYAYTRALIQAGTKTQGSNAEHISSTDYHLSAVGHADGAALLLQTVQAQSGWVNALK